MEAETPSPETHVLVPRDRLDALKRQLAAAVDMVALEWGMTKERAYKWICKDAEEAEND